METIYSASPFLRVTFRKKDIIYTNLEGTNLLEVDSTDALVLIDALFCIMAENKVWNTTDVSKLSEMDRGYLASTFHASEYTWENITREGALYFRIDLDPRNVRSRAKEYVLRGADITRVLGHLGELPALRSLFESGLYDEIETRVAKWA